MHTLRTQQVTSKKKKIIRPSIVSSDVAEIREATQSTIIHVCTQG